jgi:hypothetical protein
MKYRRVRIRAIGAGSLELFTLTGLLHICAWRVPGCLQIWEVAASVLRKQSRTADKRLFSSLGACNEMSQRASDLDGLIWFRIVPTGEF